MVLSDKVKHSDDAFKYFIGHKEGEIVKPLCIILPQMSGYIKYFIDFSTMWRVLVESTVWRLFYGVETFGAKSFLRD